MQDDPVRKWKVGGGEWDDSLRKIGHLRSKCYGRITRLIPFFRCAERYFQAFNCNSPGVSGGVSSPIKQPFQAELAYAWFVASGEVTATGMNVNVVSSGGLLIKYTGSGDGWGVIATATPSTNVDLKPASTADMTTWCTATASSPTGFGMNEGTIAPVAGTSEANFSGSYFIKRTFQIRATGNADNGTKGLFVKEVQVTGKGAEGAVGQELNMALRVGIHATYGSGASATDVNFIMAPVQVGSTAKTDGYTVYKATGDAAPYTKETAGTVTLKTPSSDAIIVPSTDPVPGNSDDNVVNVEIFIWYEGEDRHLYSDNVHANENLSVSLVFATNSTSATGGTVA